MESVVDPDDRPDVKDPGSSYRLIPERRHRPPPSSPGELLQQIPARVLLDRLPTPMIGVADNGAFVYANPACASMLGYVDVEALLGQSLAALLAGHELDSNADCIAMLRDSASKIVDWYHAEGYSIHTAVSNPLLLRADDPLLLINLTDITELLWVEASRHRRP